LNERSDDAAAAAAAAVTKLDLQIRQMGTAADELIGERKNLEASLAADGASISNLREVNYWIKTRVNPIDINLYQVRRSYWCPAATK